MTDNILSFFGADPLVAWLLTLTACFAIAAIAFAINGWLERRHQLRDDERRRQMARIVAASASAEIIHWPAPKAPKGGDWQKRRAI